MVKQVFFELNINIEEIVTAPHNLSLASGCLPSYVLHKVKHIQLKPKYCTEFEGEHHCLADTRIYMVLVFKKNKQNVFLEDIEWEFCRTVHVTYGGFRD